MQGAWFETEAQTIRWGAEKVDASIPIAAWGLEGPVQPLPGGQGRSVRVGDVVLKPAADAEEAEWCARVLDRLPERGFRLARPLRATDGRWVASGWTAWQWVAGTSTEGRWPEVLKAGRELHQALARVARPNFLARRSHRWAVADRMAWGEQAVYVIHELATPVQRLRRRLRPVAAPAQIVHGDLSGNALLADDLPPAIIDFSPYWRPVDYAHAIVVVDAMLWHGASIGLVGALDPGPDWPQYLARAWLFRALTLSQYVATVDRGAMGEVGGALSVLSEIDRLL